MEDEFAFDLVDRMADKVRNDLIYSQPTGVHRILRRRVIGRLVIASVDIVVLRSHVANRKAAGTASPKSPTGR